MKHIFYFLVLLLLISCEQSKEDKVNELKEKNERLVSIKNQYQDSLDVIKSKEAVEIVSMAEKMVGALSDEQMMKLNSTFDNETAKMRETIHKKYKSNEDILFSKIKELDSTISVNNKSLDILLELK